MGFFSYHTSFNNASFFHLPPLFIWAIKVMWYNLEEVSWKFFPAPWWWRAGSEAWDAAFFSTGWSKVRLLAFLAQPWKMMFFMNNTKFQFAHPNSPFFTSIWTWLFLPLIASITANPRCFFNHSSTQKEMGRVKSWKRWKQGSNLNTYILKKFILINVPVSLNTWRTFSLKFVQWNYW